VRETVNKLPIKLNGVEEDTDIVVTGGLLKFTLQQLQEELTLLKLHNKLMNMLPMLL
jgi:hypothetical protein